MATIDMRGEPEVVVADAACALQPTISALLATRGPVLVLAVLMMMQDWVARCAGAKTEQEIADWFDAMFDDAADLNDKAHMVLKLRSMGAAGSA